jgi:hypothetical protein
MVPERVVVGPHPLRSGLVVDMVNPTSQSVEALIALTLNSMLL